MPAPRTLVEKIWRDHLVAERPDGTVLLYVDRLLLHEVNSPQAFAAVRRAGGRVHRPESVLAMADHDLPTADRARGIADPRARLQVETLEANCREFGVPHLSPRDPRHGITHVVGPEQGLILPGMTAVCCDSHATTYGALGALGFGIGASDLEFVLRARTLIQRPPRTLRLLVEGTLGPGLSAKDLILYLIGRLGAGGGAGHAIEFAGPAVRALSLEGRMTLCNMAIEAGARAGLVAPDDSTAAYLAGRPLAPRGRLWEQALAHWSELRSDPDAVFDRELAVRVDGVAPQVTWGTSPEQVLPITGRVPDPAAAPDGANREAGSRALAYMGLVPGAALEGVGVDQVFIGSCTNGRIEDLRAAAGVAAGRRRAAGVRRVLVVPGSGPVKRQAEAEGLDRVFRAAGFEWREPGCSMCQAMNGDDLAPGERAASTSNRNFEHRQGRQARTHLVSPAMAAAAAVTGHLTDVRRLLAGAG